MPSLLYRRLLKALHPLSAQPPLPHPNPGLSAKPPRYAHPTKEAQGDTRQGFATFE